MPPPVTTTTGVLPPPPAYPPLPTVPTAPPRGVPTPGPDITIMVPDAAPKAAAFNKLDPGPPVGQIAFEPDPSLAQEHAWNLQDLFGPPPSLPAVRRNWPPTDPFTVFLMATLSRYAYSIDEGGDPRVKLAKAAIIDALDPETTFVRYTASSFPFNSFDRWTTPAGHILAFRGSVSLTQWFGYSVPALTPLTGIGTTAGVWAGIALQLAPYRAVIGDPNFGLADVGVPALMTGHSLGGALAQLLAADRNVNSTPVNNPIAKPIRGVWTFGAPAFLSSVVDNLVSDTFDLAARVYMEGDPIPYATQFVCTRAAGVAQTLAVFAPGFAQPAFSTAHLVNKSMSAAPMGVADRKRFRDAALQSLIPGHRDALIRQLIEQHSITTYTAAAWEAVRDRTDFPAARLAALRAANRHLDEANLLSETASGLGS